MPNRTPGNWNTELYELRIRCNYRGNDIEWTVCANIYDTDYYNNYYLFTFFYHAP